MGLYCTVATTETSSEPLEFPGINVGQPMYEKGQGLGLLNEIA